jgi:saccharopine dehydrogenase-like NADP-dependent oxidoreductase
MKIAVLGAGRIGHAMAKDLAAKYHVTAFDSSRQRLDDLISVNPEINGSVVDLAQYAEYENWLRPFDLVVLAVPGFMGYEALRHVILAGKNVADISFFPEDVLPLDMLAKEKGVTAIVDCGVAPGMSNWIIGYHHSITPLKGFEIYVGGLPVHPVPPYFYKAPFSPIDVVEEYTRPARIKRNGEIVVLPALTEREVKTFEGVGELEAFNTDGLRSLLFTMKDIPDQIEKTLRYPGHLDLMLTFQQSGFFSTNPVIVDGHSVIPLHLTSQLLIDQWKAAPEEPELTVMQVVMHTPDKSITYDLLDYYDPETKVTSMARTTGYTCTAAVALIAEGLFRKKGVFPPELVGPEKGCFSFVLNYLKERKVNWRYTEG